MVWDAEAVREKPIRQKDRQMIGEETITQRRRIREIIRFDFSASRNSRRKLISAAWRTASQNNNTAHQHQHHMGRAFYTPALQLFFASLANRTDWNLAMRYQDYRCFNKY